MVYAMIYTHKTLEMLEAEYTARFGHTYTVLKAQDLPAYRQQLILSLTTGKILTDDLLNLVFPPGALI